MADYSLTSRFKIPIPAQDTVDWGELIEYWIKLNEVMFSTLSRGDYVVSGFSLAYSPFTLIVTYASGTAYINNTEVSIVGNSITLIANSYNWMYIQDGQMKVSTNYPTGSTYLPIACIQTNATSTVTVADLKPSYPTVKGISITPEQVNPVENINMASSMRVLHEDSNVTSNTIMFPKAQIQTVLNWGNQTSAKAWTEVNLSTNVPNGTKFAILACNMATYNTPSTGWAILEVKTNSTDNDYVYNFVDYGHGNANVLNSNQVGNTNQIVLPLDTNKKFKARTLIDSISTGAYYATIKILGYQI